MSVLTLRAPYGVDAPGLLRGFALAGAGLLGLGLALLLGVEGIWAASGTALLALAAYPLGMAALMLRESLITKVVAREAVLDLEPWQGDEAVLDVGCGRGLLLVGAARRLVTGRAVGVDLWLERDQAANGPAATLTNAAREGVADRVRVETANMRALPFANASFDIVLSAWAVYNVELAVERWLRWSECCGLGA